MTYITLITTQDVVEFQYTEKRCKILLQLDWENYGTVKNPMYMVHSVIQCASGTFGFMRIKYRYMYF